MSARVSEVDSHQSAAGISNDTHTLEPQRRGKSRQTMRFDVRAESVFEFRTEQLG